MIKEFLSRPITKKYYDNYDAIFGKKKTTKVGGQRLLFSDATTTKEQINPPVFEKELRDAQWIGENPYSDK